MPKKHSEKKTPTPHSHGTKKDGTPKKKPGPKPSGNHQGGHHGSGMGGSPGSTPKDDKKFEAFDSMSAGG